MRCEKCSGELVMAGRRKTKQGVAEYCILDYKPDARKGKAPIAQLSSYALALSFRTKTSLQDIRCAYFDENGYYEFSTANDF